jgi:hypothetical protein
MAVSVVDNVALGLSNQYSIRPGIDTYGKAGYNILASFSPADLFKLNEVGAWYDPSDLTSMYQDSAGTIPAALEQPVGKILDKSGRGNHATQSVSTSRPTLSARYNLLTKTEDFSNAVWVKTGLLAFGSGSTVNAAVAPDGTTTAGLITEDTSTGNHRLYSVADTTTGIRKFSVSVKNASGSRYVALRLSLNALNHAHCIFDLSNSTYSASASITSPSIVSQGDGWYRLSITVNSTTSPTPLVYLSNTATAPIETATDVTYTGDGTSGIYLWGADLRVANDGVGLPAYQRVNTASDYDTTGFPYYLKFDGTDDSLATGSIDFTATDKMTVFAGVRKLNDPGYGCIAELSSNYDSNQGVFTFGVTLAILFGSKGSLAASAYASLTSPATRVVTASGNISGDYANLRANAAQFATSAADQGTGNYGNYALNIGRRNGSTFPFNGRLYSLIVRGAASTAAHITSAEQWVNSRTKAF